MPEPSPHNEQEQADLVAYLDGELTGEAARALEAKLSLDPAARAEAKALRRTWDLLDYLPRPQPSSSFTHRTLERLSPVRASESRRGPRWRSGCLGVGWVAALLLAGWAGYAGYNWFVPRQPGDKELIHDLRLIENKRSYDLMENLEFWKALDTPDLFGDEQTSS
jgi:ferric-dicitrate binding protein FerR (iron transport regulator)